MIKVLTVEPNAIEARNIASRSRRESVGKDLEKISSEIKVQSNLGRNYISYQISHKENMDLIIDILRGQGYKVKRCWLMHSAYNEIEVKW